MNVMTLPILTEKISAFFYENSSEVAINISTDTNLIDDLLQNSLMMVRFVVYLEVILGKVIPIGDFDLCKIKTIELIYENYFLE